MTKDQRGCIDCTDITTSLESLSVDGDASLRSTATRSVEEPRPGLFQLGDSGLPDLTFLWPLPLWAAGYWAHMRYRAWRPRRIPPFAHLSLRQLYGTFALGHCADVAADGMRERLKRVWNDERACGRVDNAGEDDRDGGERGRDGDRAYIEKWSWALMRMAEKFPDDVKILRVWTHLSTKDPERDLSLLVPGNQFSLSNPLSAPWCYIQDVFLVSHISHLWCTQEARMLMTLRLKERCRTHGLSANDTSILTVFMAERLTIGRSYICAHHPALQGYLPWLVGLGGAVNVFVLRGRVLTSFVGSAAQLWHRMWWFALAYRLFAARYEHYAALWKLEDSQEAAAVLHEWLKKESEPKEPTQKLYRLEQK